MKNETVIIMGVWVVVLFIFWITYLVIKKLRGGGSMIDWDKVREL